MLLPYAEGAPADGAVAEPAHHSLADSGPLVGGSHGASSGAGGFPHREGFAFGISSTLDSSSVLLARRAKTEVSSFDQIKSRRPAEKGQWELEIR